jgi:excisionase family DNA binding protein
MKIKATQTKTEIVPAYLRTSEAARYLSVSARTIRDWQSRRMIPFMRMGRKVILFKRSDLDRALDRFRVDAIGE